MEGQHLRTDPYRDGTYFSDSSRHAGDARFKAEALIRLLQKVARRVPVQISSIADVGCGSGDVTVALQQLLPSIGYAPSIQGWDVSPHVNQINKEGIEFIHGDFCTAGQVVDLVTLFDVFEHIPAPTKFLDQIASHCRWLGLHIPLDNCWNASFRDLFRTNLQDPGHLICLDTPAALNFLSLAGLVTVDYDYTFGFRAPPTRPTLLRTLGYPIRVAIAALSPWLLSKTLGGASLMVLAEGKL